VFQKTCDHVFDDKLRTVCLQRFLAHYY